MSNKKLRFSTVPLLRYSNQHIPGLLEVSIGHALIADALYLGVEKTIKRHLVALKA